MIWRYAGANAAKWTNQGKVSGEAVEVEMKFILPTTSQAVMETKITIRPDGSILFDNTYKGGENLPDIPEAGLLFTLPESFDRFEWHGRENTKTTLTGTAPPL